jgi:hypothetical protein
MYSRLAIQSFDEELELYEMLDVESELDTGVDIDDDTGDILIG